MSILRVVVTTSLLNDALSSWVPSHKQSNWGPVIFLMHQPVCSSGGWHDHSLISADGMEPNICWWLVMTCGRTAMTTHTWWIPNTTTQHVLWSSIHRHAPIHWWGLALPSTHSRHHGIHESLILSSWMTTIGLSIKMMHMEIIISALLRVQHPCPLMKRPPKITKTIPLHMGITYGRSSSCVLQVNLHQFVHACSQAPLDSDNVDKEMFTT
jgi:hypothetical protein